MRSQCRVEFIDSDRERLKISGVSAPRSKEGRSGMRLYLNKKEVLVIKRILESHKGDVQEREVTQALLRRIAKCQAMQDARRNLPR